jgi:hypothetical protein
MGKLENDVSPTFCHGHDENSWQKSGSRQNIAIYRELEGWLTISQQNSYLP